jgi:16S rRNA processing protein RimM
MPSPTDSSPPASVLAVAEDDPVLMGYVVGVFGTRGWLKIHSYTRPRSNLLDYPVWLFGKPGSWRPLKILACKIHGPSLVASLDGIMTREQAAEFVREQIAVTRAALPVLPEDEHYWADLLGMTVVNLDGAKLGRVVRLVEAGDHDVLVIRDEREYLIPFVRDRYICEVDRAVKRILVDWHLDD